MVNKSLFELVKSLNKAEKRHVKLYKLDYENGKGDIYIRFFDELCKCKERADATAFIENLSLTKKKLNNLQNYLYHIILSGLKNFKSEASVDIRLHNLMIEVNILFEKSLLTQCLKKLERAEEIAARYELTGFQHMIGLLQESVHLQMNSLFFTNPAIKQDGIFKALKIQRKAVQSLVSEVSYRELATGYFSDSSQFSTRKKATAHLEHLLNNPLIKNVNEQGLSMQAWSTLSALRSLAYFFAGKFKEGEVHTAAQLKTIREKYFHIAMESPIYWIETIYNYIGYCYYLRDYKKILSLLEEIKTLLNSKGVTGGGLAETRLWFNYYQYRLVISVRTARFENMSTILKEIGSFLTDHNKFIQPEYYVSLNYYIAYNLFTKGNYKESIFWLNKIINDPNTDSRRDYQVQTRVFYFILQVERKNVDMYKTAYDLFTEYLEEKSMQGKFERAFKGFMKECLDQPESGIPPKKYLQKFKKDLEDLKADETEERKVTQYFDYFSWLESKIEKQAFIEVYKRRNNLD